MPDFTSVNYHWLSLSARQYAEFNKVQNNQWRLCYGNKLAIPCCMQCEPRPRHAILQKSYMSVRIPRSAPGSINATLTNYAPIRSKFEQIGVVYSLTLVKLT